MIHLTLQQHWHSSIHFDAFVTLLIEEKKGGGFAGVYSAKCGARCKKCFTPQRNETATFATLFYKRSGRLSRITV
jgi:hypothetical protein